MQGLLYLLSHGGIVLGQPQPGSAGAGANINCAVGTRWIVNRILPPFNHFANSTILQAHCFARTTLWPYGLRPNQKLTIATGTSMAAVQDNE